MADDTTDQEELRKYLQILQSMIDVSAERLEGLRTQCATSAELTQQEIRTLEVSPFKRPGGPLRETSERTVKQKRNVLQLSPHFVCLQTAAIVSEQISLKYVVLELLFL